MATRKPTPQLPPLGQKQDPLRHWLEWAARKLGFLPEALTTTKVWNPGNIATGTYTYTFVDLPGARPGDPVSVGFSSARSHGAFFHGQVFANDVVRVNLGNLFGGDVNELSGTLTVVVWRVI